MAPKQETRVIRALLERLYVSLGRGPAINCWPGRSRQRVDLSALDGLRATPAREIFTELLGDRGKCRVRVSLEKVLQPAAEEPSDPEAKKAWEEQRRRWREQQEKSRLLSRLATIADDARTYEQDTGAYILYVGYPLLSIPPAEGKARSSRVLAPLAFIPVRVAVGQGSSPFVEISCTEEGSERVIPNEALRIWLERQTGKPFPEELFADEDGTDPRREITDLVAHVASLMEIAQVPSFEGWPLAPVPGKTEDLPGSPALLACAVLGLYRLDYQNTIADLEALEKAEAIPPTVHPFLTLDESLVESDSTDHSGQDEAVPGGVLSLEDEHLVTHADPCQRRAVAQARRARGLVIHGPPGTGKSQTITNIIGDSLARGERVLFVCEKRTALDVVKHRLDRLGLGDLCAVVHDAARDRTPLYKDVREMLENLTGSAAEPDPARELKRATAELKTITQELRAYFDALAEGDESSPLSFGELAGQWFESFATVGREKLVELHPDLGQVPVELLLQREGEVRGALERMERCHYADNAWVAVHGTSLGELLERDMHSVRNTLQQCVERGRTAEEMRVDGLPGYRPDADLAAQGEARSETGRKLKNLAALAPAGVRAAVAAFDRSALATVRQELEQLAPSRALLASALPEPELRLTFDASPWPLPRVAEALADLENYLAKSRGFFAFLAFGARKRAAAALAPLGLPLSLENAARARSFLQGARARMLVRAFVERTLGPNGAVPAPGDDGALLACLDALEAMTAFLDSVLTLPELQPLEEAVRAALPDDSSLSALAAKLERCRQEAASLAALLASLEELRLLRPDALQRMREKLLFGKPLTNDVEKLRDDAESLEELLRFEAEAASFAAPLADSLLRLGRADVTPDEAWHQLLAGILSGTLQARLRRRPVLQQMDPRKIESHVARMRELVPIRQELECRAIRHLWQTRQRRRLLAATGSRLNSDGADLRRRMTLRGRNASRIRQVVQQGRQIEGGDPLFDLKPVWMTSPETVAQIIPLEPIFDLVIFDEASQCRLEHGLPVLARGHRVCVAGDTKQLPPTRFFDTAVTASGEAEESDDGPESLFVSQQSEIEDLLSAALNIEVEQSYLDVHYRSSSEDLICFSNDSFYGSRLQAIPGHPNNRREEPPVRLHQVNGVYADRQNQAEAEYVVNLIKGLLRRADPPSIGVVTFNLQQKDLITRALDTAAEEDAAFRQALAAARARQGDSSFEGLFVKNLENVQGDERDWIIISTTYGPDAQGRFYRRFGPLGQTGGERRLNVIITRAREQVELVTSIPAEVYRAPVEVPEGKRPNGGWYLMGYLRYAEGLADRYARAREEHRAEEAAEAGLPATVTPAGPVVPVRMADALAARLASARGTSSWLYYGTEGFYVDVAFRHPVRTKNATVGVLCDATRYPRAQDPVEWDCFQTLVLESQNWKLHRLWTPHFFRDPEGALERLHRELGEMEMISGQDGETAIRNP